LICISAAGTLLSCLNTCNPKFAIVPEELACCPLLPCCPPIVAAIAIAHLWSHIAWRAGTVSDGVLSAMDCGQSRMVSEGCVLMSRHGDAPVTGGPGTDAGAVPGLLVP
jgi:hypothetical protein